VTDPLGPLREQFRVLAPLLPPDLSPLGLARLALDMALPYLMWTALFAGARWIAKGLWDE
jgi:hypothetical protein